MSKTLVTKTSEGTTRSAATDFPAVCPQCGLEWVPFMGDNDCWRAYCGDCKAQCYEELPAALEPTPVAERAVTRRKREK